MVSPPEQRSAALLGDERPEGERKMGLRSDAEPPLFLPPRTLVAVRSIVSRSVRPHSARKRRGPRRRGPDAATGSTDQRPAAKQRKMARDPAEQLRRPSVAAQGGDRDHEAGPRARQQTQDRHCLRHLVGPGARSLCFEQRRRYAWLAEAKTLAFALGERGIHVNTLSLGGTLTPRYSASLEKRAVTARATLARRLALHDGGFTKAY
jgi:hypothetical protein